MPQDFFLFLSVSRNFVISSENSTISKTNFADLEFRIVRSVYIRIGASFALVAF